VKAFPHEIRTPLTGILGCAEILKEEGELPAEEVKKMGTAIYKSGQRLHRLLENFILIGELQSWVKDPHAITVMRRESTTLLQELIHSVAEREQAHQGRLSSVNITVKNSPVQISVAHFTKIMEEVIGNAIKFSERGKGIVISSDENAAEVHINVHDEGRGMPTEQIDKGAAFQQFEPRHRDQQGVGVGLAIAKTLAELYGGSLTVESAEGKGTTVRITLLRPKDSKFSI